MSVEISGKMSAVAVTPVITAGAYTAGKIIGTLLTFTQALGVKQSGIVHGLLIFDKNKQNSAVDLVLFRGVPTDTYTDGQTFSPNDDDLLLMAGTVSVVAANYASFDDNSMATVASIGLPVKNFIADAVGQARLGENLYGVLVSRGTPTYASTSDITVQPLVLQD